jgi:hypothetical protein
MSKEIKDDAAEEIVDTTQISAKELSAVDVEAGAAAKPIAPEKKSYVVAIDQHNAEGQQVSSLTYGPLEWRGKLGDAVPANVITALSERPTNGGALANALEQWLHIGWIKEA